MIWNGLWQKESWMMRGWLTGTVFIGLFLSFALPLLLTYFWTWKFAQDESQFYFIVLIWLCCTLFIPLSLAMSSITMEMERPDVWLYTPASIFHLLGVKVVYAITIGFVNILVAIIGLLFFLRITDALSTLLTIGELIKFALHSIAVLTMFSVFILLIGLFFRAIHLFLKPYFRSSTLLITIGLFIAFAVLLDGIQKTTLYTKISLIGPIGKVKDNALEIGGEGSALVVGSDEIYVGNTLLLCALAGFLFITAALLFEKKVRL